jgi:hypothetical protein
MTKGSAPSPVAEAQTEQRPASHVAVGDYVLRVDPTKGAIVHALKSEGQIRLRPRATPIDTRPPGLSELQGRTQEIRDAMAARVSHEPIEFVGPPGIGKTTLLRHLLYLVPEELYPSGLFFLSVSHKPLLDLQQALFELFYHQDIPVRPTEPQLRQALKDKQALIALDDAELSRDELVVLMEAAPRCTFILASVESHLWNEGCTVTLHGLSWRDATALMERELDRPLAIEEKPAAYVLYTSLGGNPLHILRTAAMAREQNLSLRSIAGLASPAFNAEMLTAIALSTLSDAQVRVLAALAALNGAWVHFEHLSPLTGFQDVKALLETLERRYLVEAHGPRYRLTGTLAQDLHSAHRLQALLRGRNPELESEGEPLQELDLHLWSERALNHFASWADQHRSSSGRLLEETDVLIQVLDWGVGASQWPTVLRLTRTVEASFALGGRWGTWERVLNMMYRAAQAMGDREVQAWALHQLGSRALCLEDLSPVRAYLNQALSIRQDLGDQAGEEITQRNLSLIEVTEPPPAAKEEKVREELWEPAVPLPIVKALAFIAVLVPVVLLVWASCVSIARSLPRAEKFDQRDTSTLSESALPEPTLMRTVTAEVAPLITGASTNPDPATPSSVTAPLPDLTSALYVRGEITVDSEGQTRVPVQIVVANQGGSQAGDFEVSLIYRDQIEQPEPAELVSWHISSFSVTPLAAGAVVTGEGTLVFPFGWQAGTLVLGTIADSCIGAPSPPDYCRVNEQDETNNQSEPVRIIVP